LRVEGTIGSLSITFMWATRSLFLALKCAGKRHLP
jgi:hypothetical protein